MNEQWIVYVAVLPEPRYVGPFATKVQAQAWASRHLSNEIVVIYPITAPRRWRVGGTS